MRATNSLFFFNKCLDANKCSNLLDLYFFSSSNLIKTIWYVVYPVAVGISDTREASDRLLTTAGSVRHIVRMQTKLSLLVHQLNRTPISYLPLELKHLSIWSNHNSYLISEFENQYLDAFFTGSCGGSGGVAWIGIKAQVEEESEAEESQSHQEEESDEPVPLIKGKFGDRFPRRGSS